MNRTDHGRVRNVSAAEVSHRVSAPIVVLAETGNRSPRVVSSPVAGPFSYGCGNSLNDSEVCEAMVSSCGDSEGHAGETACPSQLPVHGCSELLHELSNLMTGVLLNAQMLEWKLPPYSHLKRPIREIARNSQRGSELMKALLRRCSGSDLYARSSANAAAVSGGQDEGNIARAMGLSTCGPNARCDTGLDLTAGCDPRTSNAFPKRDDRDGRK